MPLVKVEYLASKPLLVSAANLNALKEKSNF